jgi:hypothetical protein
MPSKFAALSLSSIHVFLGLVYWGFIFWTQLAWVFFIMGRLGGGIISLASPIWSMPSFFCAGRGIFGSMDDGLDLTLLGGSEDSVREVE